MRPPIAALMAAVLAACSAPAMTPGDPPEDLGSAEAAVAVAGRYYALLEAGRTREAAELREDGREEDLKPFLTLDAEVGPAGRIEGAAGSLYVTVPVALSGRLVTGGDYRAAARATLRRSNDVPGASTRQRRWRIHRIEVDPSGGRPTG